MKTPRLASLRPVFERALPLAATLVLGCGNVVYEGTPVKTHEPAPFTRHFGGTLDQAVTAAAYDADGNVILCGTSTGDADLGGGPKPGGSGTDLFVTKLAPDGATVFAQRYAGGTVSCGGLVVDATGDIYLTGSYMGQNLALGDGLPGNETIPHVFVARLAPTGKARWAVQVDPLMTHAYGGAIALRPDGELVVAGIDDEGLFFLTLLPDGKVDSRVIAGQMMMGWWPRAGVRALAIGPDGDLFVTGNYTFSASLGSMETNGVYSQGFLARVRPDGQPLWAESFGEEHVSHSNTGASVSLDPEGNLIVAGHQLTKPGQPGSPVQEQPFVQKRDPKTGEVLWQTVLGDATEGGLAAIDSKGDILHVTWRNNETDTLPSGTFVASLRGSDGALQKTVSVPEVPSAQVFAIGPNDEVLVAGTFVSAVETPDGTVESEGSDDVMVVNLGEWQSP
ncbi:MAG: hypothetical protein U0441_35100 [Polyangiaceae bacterium]